MRSVPHLLLALTLLLQGCSWFRPAKPAKSAKAPQARATAPRTAPPAQPAPPTPPPPPAMSPQTEGIPAAPPAPPPPAPPAPSPAAKAYAAGEAALSHGHYESALDAFASAWRENPGYPGVAADFPAALAGLKKSADDAARAGHLEDAGKRYAAVLRYLPHPAASRGKPLGFGKADVKAAMDRASDALMERGLAEYRRGNLDGALVPWRAILVYDPTHEEAAKSLRTVQTQMENLKKFPPPRN